MDPASLGSLDASSGVLTEVLTAFTAFINTGTQKVVGAEAKLAGALLAFQLLKVIIEVGITRSSVGRVILDLVEAGLWYSVAKNAVSVVAAWSSWCGSLGSFMGAPNGDVMRNPSLIIALGYDSLGNLIGKSASFDNFFTGGVAFCLYLLVGLAVFACFAAMGFAAVYVVVMSTLEMVVGLSLVPFIIEPRLAFLASKGFGMIIEAGIGLATTSVCIGMAYGFVQKYHLPAHATVRDGMQLFLAAGLCAAVTVGAANFKGGAAMVMRAVGSLLA